MERDKAFELWANLEDEPTYQGAFIAGWEAAIGEFVCKPIQNEPTPTLEGVIEYLENQNDLAFLAYRTIERGSEPGMHASVRARLLGDTYMVWQGVGDALNKAREAAKLNTESIIAR